MKKSFKLTLLFFCLSCIGIGIFSSCSNGPKLEGMWESSTAVSYEFTKSTYTMKVNILFAVAKISGPYRIDGDSLFVTAEKISFDDGKTWTKNNGEIFSTDEQILPLTFNSDGTISISNMVYTKAKK